MARTQRDWPNRDHYDGRRKYDWEKWMDGQLWRMEPGKDFECTSAGFCNAARDYAKRHKIKLRLSSAAHLKGAVLIQAVKKK